MTTEIVPQKLSEDRLRGMRGGRLAAKPIMIYPATPEEREQITRAAASCRRSVSAFVMESSLQASRTLLEKTSFPPKASSPFPADESPQTETQSRVECRTDETPSERAFRLTERILGLMKDEIAAHGGTEGYMRWVRSDDDEETP